MIRKTRGRRAVTLLELLIVVSIIGILFAVIVPAVQAAREAVRRTTCGNNLHQVGVAIHSFESSRGSLPGIDDAQPRPLERYRSLSISGQLASFLSGGDALTSKIDEWKQDQEERAVAAPAVLLCPSDPEAYGSAVSYRYNQGSSPPRGWGNGVFSHLRMTTAQVGDGLAQTAFVAERVVYRQSIDSLKHPGSMYLTVDDQDLSPADCIALNKSGFGTLAAQAAGDDWLWADWKHSAYLHWFRPNTGWHDCTRKVDFSALITARSYHPGGVHVLFGDGSVRFVDDTIDLGAWRAMGTRQQTDRTQ